MIKSKLLKTLRLFSADEMHRLEAFFKSPYFHPTPLKEDEWKFFALLQKHFPKLDSTELEKEQVNLWLYPDEQLVKGRLEKKMTTLLKGIEHFIYQEQLARRKEDASHLLELARFYYRKGEKHLFEVNMTRLRKRLGTIEKKGPEELHLGYLMEKEISDHQSVYNTRSKDPNLVNVLNALDKYYVVSKLEYSCGLLAQKTFHHEIDVQNSLLFLEKIEPLLQKEIFAEVPTIKIYSHLFSILHKMGENETDFVALEELEVLLEKYKEELPFEHLKTFYAFSRNFCIRQYNRGRGDLLANIFSQYKLHLEKDYIFYNEGLLSGIYRNIAACGLRLKEYDWVYAFLEKYKDRIVGANAPLDIYHFNLANYYFKQKKYEKALTYLVNTYDDLYYQLGAKRMELKICFEVKSDSLKSKLGAFHVYLHRLAKNKLQNSTQKANANFTKALKQILHPKTNSNSKRRQGLREKITNISIIRDKDWLLEKLA